VFNSALGSLDDAPQRGGSVGRGARVIHDRQEVLRAAMDRATRTPGIAAARQLVSVYNGGNMPTQPDHVFLAHPVELDGAEVEGGVGSPSVNTSATIPVIVLWDTPQAGDLLVASAVGGRWVAERTGGSQTTICVSTCSPAVPVYGAVVTIKSGSNAVASGTTGTGGCVTLPVSGSYTIQVQVGGTQVYSGLRSLSVGSTTTISLGSNSGLVCCGGYAIPQNLTLTDAAGSLQFSYYPNYYYPIWYGGHAVTRQSCSATTPNNICVVAAPSDGPVRICYQMICYAGSNPTFSIQRSWSWVYQQGTLMPIWYQDPTGFTPGQTCSTAPPAICGSPHTDTASFSANPSSTNPFTLAGTPVAGTSNYTSDPVGGSIVISQ
jgi:hypothetical protein